MNLPPNLREAIDALESEADSSYIIACSINLYSECLRRKAGRVLFGPKDVENLFSMCRMLLDVQDPGTFAPPSRVEPTEEELDKVRDAYSQIAEAVQGFSNETHTLNERRL